MHSILNLYFSYVTRYNVKDSGRHVILGMQHFKPTDFAQQINLSMENAWGIVRCILDMVMKLKVSFVSVSVPSKKFLCFLRGRKD